MTTIGPTFSSNKKPKINVSERPKSADAEDSIKEEYRDFCRKETSLPLFAQDWWLDAAVGPTEWNVALIKKNAVVVASMPYILRNRYGMRLLTQPALTPILGPWLRPCDGNASKKLSYETELMQSLIDQLPPFDHFAQTWHPCHKNWQPFYWNGFQQTTYYTNILSNLSDIQKIWEGLSPDVRRIVNKAEKEKHLIVRDDFGIDTLLELNRKTFKRQGLTPPFPDELVRRLDTACLERGCRKLLVAVDSNGIPHAGYYFVWDQQSAYGLLAGSDPAYRQSGAASLCLWTTIVQAASVSRQYNFCGSMIESVATFMRNFGAEHVPYFHISKTPSRLLNIRKIILALVEAK